jgi:hypothetical protein
MYTRKWFSVHPDDQHSSDLSLPFHGSKSARADVKTCRGPVFVVCVVRDNVAWVETCHEDGKFEEDGHDRGFHILENEIGREDEFVCETAKVMFCDIAVGSYNTSFDGCIHDNERSLAGGIPDNIADETQARSWGFPGILPNTNFG